MTTRLILTVVLLAALPASVGADGGAGPEREAVAPVGGNGALLLGRDRSNGLFFLLQGSRRPEAVRGASVADGGAAWSPTGRLVAFTDDSGVGPHVAIARRPSRTSVRLRGSWGLLDWQPLCTLRGAPGADRIRARARADLVCGFRRADVIHGGAGQDRLFGEEGDDRFLARDGEFDVVGCGTGRDTVLADRGDLVGFDCEQVVRR